MDRLLILLGVRADPQVTPYTLKTAPASLRAIWVIAVVLAMVLLNLIIKAF